MAPRLLVHLTHPPPALLVHGGAWALPSGEAPAHVAGVERAAAAGFRVLAEGGTALDGAVAAVQLLEEDPLFDAAVGSFLTREGRVEMDAACMRGRDLALGAVAAVRRVGSPVGLARRLLERGEECLVVGEGAERLAAELGEPLLPAERFVVPRERERYARWRRGEVEAALRAPFGDTVGAVAVDAAGGVAVATSTGGTPFKRGGRVGDTPVGGAGFLADDARGACAATGHGESILRVQLAARALAGLRRGGAAAALRTALADLTRRLRGRAGLILVTPTGELAAACSTPFMPCAWRTAALGAARGTA